MDDADLAQARLEREDALRRRAARTPDLPYAGACYWCGEPLPPPQRWCDAECRDAWDHTWRR